jgi:hypothetical protein
MAITVATAIPATIRIGNASKKIKEKVSRLLLGYSFDF